MLKNPIVLIVLALVVFVFAGLTLKTLKINSLKFSGGKSMKITSPAFADNQAIPPKYTCDGDNINPPLTFADVPSGTKSLALIVDDLDSPNGIFNHWLVWNISPSSLSVPEKSQLIGITGTNTFGQLNYGGPCPNAGTHRYVFTVYALDTKPDLRIGSQKADLEKAISSHVLAQGQLLGTYARK